MIFLVTWNPLPGAHKDVVARFLSGRMTPPAGVKLVGRYHKVGGGGFSIVEADSIEPLVEAALAHADIIKTTIDPVVDDAAAVSIAEKLK